MKQTINTNQSTGGTTIDNQTVYQDKRQNIEKFMDYAYGIQTTTIPELFDIVSRYNHMYPNQFATIIQPADWNNEDMSKYAKMYYCIDYNDYFVVLIYSIHE